MMRTFCKRLIFIFYFLPICSIAHAGAPVHFSQQVHANPSKTANTLLKERQTELDQADLAEQNASNLGEMLSKQAGIHNQSYGANSGKPVMRSLTGSRVKILQNQLPSSIASDLSPQLASGIAPQSIDSIEIYPIGSSILYGSDAIGGAINIKDNTLPRQFYTKPQGHIQTQGSITNATEQQSLKLAASLSPKIAWSVYGLNSRRGDVDIAGNAKADLCYQLGTPETGLSVVVQDLCQIKIPHEVDFNPAAYKVIDGKPNPNYDPSAPPYLYRLGKIQNLTPNYRNRLPNSQSAQRAGKAGLAYHHDGLFAGVGVSHFDSHFGVPFFALTSNKSGVSSQAPVSVKSRERRVFAHVEQQFAPALVKQLTLDIGTLDARNQEWVGQKVMSDFTERQQQLRLEWAHDFPNVQGSIGFSHNLNDLDTSGKDRYLPDMQIRQQGWFVLERFLIQQSRLSVGLRGDKTRYQKQGDEPFIPLRHGSPTVENRDFSTLSHLGSWTLPLYRQLELTISHSRTSRAPAVHELYANGLHYAILTAEAGDADLKPERALTNELSLNWEGDFLALKISQYQTDYENFIYLAHTGISDPATNLYKKAWRQSDSKISGYEIESKIYLDFANWGSWQLRAFADLVKNYPHQPKRMQKHSEGEYLPGLPTSRVGAGASVQLGNWRAHVDGVHYFVQKHRGNVINPEPELPAYTLVDARVSYDWNLPQNQQVGVYLQGFNLLNRAARAYNSPIKYLAPGAGRSFAMGMDYRF